MAQARRVGALHVLDGPAALPCDARTREHFDWLAEEVIEVDGEARVSVARLGSEAEERRLVAAANEAVEAQSGREFTPPTPPGILAVGPSSGG